jgi:hypothetical protein
MPIAGDTMLRTREFRSYDDTVNQLDTNSVSGFLEIATRYRDEWFPNEPTWDLGFVGIDARTGR